MEVDSVLVTGANRGIGLEFVKQLVNLPKPPRLVFATYRNIGTIKVLNDIRDATKKSQVILLKMDVTKAEDIECAKKTVDDLVGEKGLTLLVNNAGALTMQPFPEVTDDNLLFHFNTNTLGPIKLLKAMLPLLQRSADFHRASKVGVSRAAVLNISSVGGSIATCLPFPTCIGYQISKAALNMAMRVISVQTKDQGILVVQMCPGWVKTDMGSAGDVLEVNESSVKKEVGAAQEVDESVSSILDTLSKLDASHHGAFVNNKGDAIPF